MIRGGALPSGGDVAPPVKVLKVSFPSPTHSSSRSFAAAAAAAADSNGNSAYGRYISSSRSPRGSPGAAVPEAPPDDGGSATSRSSSSICSSGSSASRTCVSTLSQGNYRGPPSSSLSSSSSSAISSSSIGRSKGWADRPRPMEVFVPSCIYFTEDPLTGRPQPPAPSPSQQKQQQQQQQQQHFAAGQGEPAAAAGAAAAFPSPMKPSYAEKQQHQELHLPSSAEAAAAAAAGETDDHEQQQWGSRLSFLMASLGAAVGIGCVWRFPAYCYKWGGGAFLLPYLLLLLLLGVPLLAVEMALGQVFRGGHMRVLSLLSPSLRGLAAATLLLSFCICSYYAVFLAWGFIYLFSSLSPLLPWTVSTAEAAVCMGPSLQQETACAAARAAGAFCHWEATTAAPASAAAAAAVGGRCVADAEAKAASFFASEVLLQQPTAAAAGGALTLAWPTALCLLLVWLCVYLGLFRGLQGMKCLCYLSVLLPTACVLLLMVRAVSLPGASLGVSRLFSLDWDILAGNAEVWAEAASQVFFSLGVFQGVMSAYASRKPPTQNTTVDALAVAACNAILSIVSAAAAFAVAGHVASAGSPAGGDVDWTRLRLEGPQLVFVLYPMALASLPAPHFFCLLFFASFILLGISSVASLIQPIIDLLLQSRAFAGRARLWVTALCLCCLCFLLGLFFCLRSSNGVVVLETADYHWGVVGLLLVGTVESLAFGWVYGLGRQRRHIGGRAAYGFVAVYVAALLISCSLGFFGGSATVAAAGTSAAIGLMLGGAAVCLSFALRFSSRKQRQKAAVAAGAAAATAAAAVYREELAAVVGDDFVVCGFVDAAAAARRTQQRAAAAAAAAEAAEVGGSSSSAEDIGEMPRSPALCAAVTTPVVPPVVPSSSTSSTLASIPSSSSSSNNSLDSVKSGIGSVAFWLFWGNVEHLRRNLNVITSSDCRSLRLRPVWSLLLKYIMPAVVCILLFQSLKRGTQSLPYDATAAAWKAGPAPAFGGPQGASWAFQGPTVAVLLLVVVVTAAGIVWPHLFAPLIPADMDTGSSRVAAAIARGRRHPLQHPGKAATYPQQQQQQQQQQQHQRSSSGSSTGGGSSKRPHDHETATQASDLHSF